MNSYISEKRRFYHNKLLKSILTVDDKGIPSNADKASNLSVRIAKGITDILKSEVHVKALGQTSGSKFEAVNLEYLENTFLKLNNIRPGRWAIQRLGNRNKVGIADFEQYAHLNALNELSKKNCVLASALGNDYTITPDIIISQYLLDDEEINKSLKLVDDGVCKQAAIRKKNCGKPILHASISSKWTIRSDRSQNSRTEALNLIRNRKGRLPHIVVVTAEPLPSRIASIALGTGDIDCVYHFALYELTDTVQNIGSEDSIELLKIMIKGKRLKDISDLPLDLTI